MLSRPLLLNPGPVSLTPRVRNALLRDDICHREPDFAELMLSLKIELGRVYAAEGAGFDALVLTGSGTCAVEAMVSSLTPRTGTTLVLSNGVYGERIAQMLRLRGRPCEEIRIEWLCPIDLSKVEAALQTNPAVSHVIAVHNETTTGRLNAIPGLADLCRQYGKWLLLDAVSSFGAEEIDFTHPSLLAVASTGNKCLHGIVGIAFVLVRQDWFVRHPSQAEALYLDLANYQRDQQTGFSPFTQATHACFALKEALAELGEQGGWTARRDRYRQLSLRLRRALADLGVALVLDETDYSSMISSFSLPSGWYYQRLHDALRDAGFIIYAGQGSLYHSMFRICTMGNISDDDMDRLIATLSAMFGEAAA